MLLRIEKHFKSEQAARQKAEELLQTAIGSEAPRHSLEHEKAMVKKVRAAGGSEG